MDLSPNGAKFIRLHEGFVPRFYLDATLTGTIGIGFTWASAAFRKWWAEHRRGVKFAAGATMTRAEAEEVLILLCREEYGKAVNAFFGSTAIPQHAFDASTSVTFNAGPGTLKDEWAKKAKAQAWASAAFLLRTTRVTSKGKRLAGLVRRRGEEADLLKSGDYGFAAIAVPSPAPVDAMADGVLMRGERGPAVAVLIRDLTTLGIYDGVPDDIFGYGTEAAVLAFQRKKGLTVDGDAGPRTLAAIAAALAEKKPATPLPAPGGSNPAPKPAAPAPAPAEAKPVGLWPRLLAALVALLKR